MTLRRRMNPDDLTVRTKPARTAAAIVVGSFFIGFFIGLIAGCT